MFRNLESVVIMSARGSRRLVLSMAVERTSGRNPFRAAGTALRNQKPWRAVSKIEKHSPLPRVGQRAGQIAVRVEHGSGESEGVRDQISGAQSLEHQPPIVQSIVLQVFHQRHAAHRFGGADAALHTVRASSLHVRTPDSDDRLGMLSRRFDRLLHLKIGGIGCRLSFQHAAAHDVEKGQHANPRSIDHQLLERLEALPAGAAAVDDGRHAMTERVVIGIDVAPVGTRISLAKYGLGIDVGMKIDKAGCDVVGADVHGRPGLLRRQIGRDARDALSNDRDVEAPVPAARRIDDVAVLEQQVVDRLIVFAAVAAAAACRLLGRILEPRRADAREFRRRIRPSANARPSRS